MPRSISQTRRALPYCSSILARNGRQGLVVLGVTGENLVGQRQAFRRDHQSDHHLRAIRPAVAAVAVPAFVAVRRGRVAAKERTSTDIADVSYRVQGDSIGPGWV